MIIFTSSIAFLAIIICIYCVVSKVKTDTQTQKINKQIFLENKQLSEQHDLLLKAKSILDNAVQLQTHKLDELEQCEQRNKDRLSYLQTNCTNLANQEKLERERISQMQQKIQDSLENQKRLSQQAFTSWCDILDKNYKEKELEYDNSTNILNKSYEQLQLKLLAEKEACQADLDRLKATRAAAIEAQRKEKEIKEQSSFYCLQVIDEDKSDIQRLESIKKTLHKPRVLSMLIWSTYYQKSLKSLSANVLGTTDIVTGIYKITNIITNECYIGQARDVASRWSEHAKCGLGIDTPAGNKLYKAMQEYGLYSFSWELLEKCSCDELNKKERFYIDLYDSSNYGYNTLKGIGVKNGKF